MTIHQLLNSRFGPIHPENVIPTNGNYFVTSSSEFVAMHDGELFIAIDRKTNRFAAQRGKSIVRGDAAAPLTEDELAFLTATATTTATAISA
jgi:hypothetical protein